MKTLYVFVNGVMTFPADSRNWNGRAVTWTHVHTDARAEKIEYFASYVGRVFGQKARAEKLYRTLSYYPGWDIVLVGHSNGADVIVDYLREFHALPYIRHVHLVCGACESNFQKNGLNDQLKAGNIGDVTVYCAGQDRALQVAHTWAGKLLGYGTVGLDGPTGVLASVNSRVHRVDWPAYGHSDCWADSVFDWTMQKLTER